MAKPWERLPEESDLAFTVFTHWLTCPRSIHNPTTFSQYLRHNHGLIVSPESIVDWRKRFAWKSRFAAWNQCLQAQRLKLVAGSVAKESAKIAIKQAQGRRIALEKAIKSLQRIDAGNARDEDVTQAAIRKAIENIGLCVLDHADQLRRLSSSGGSGGDQEPTEAEEVIPPIPDESGCLQHDGVEAETVLGQATGDLPGDRGPVDSDGDGDHGERSR